MDKSKEAIEQALVELLDELLENGNQDGAIKGLSYDPETELATVTMSTCIVEEDNYIGFQGY